MSLYFYHYRTPPGGMLPDHVGSEHESDEAGVTEAVRTVADLIRGGSTFTRGGAFGVHNDAGWLVETVPLWSTKRPADFCAYPQSQELPVP